MNRIAAAVAVIALCCHGAALAAGAEPDWRWTVPWTPVAPGLELAVASSPGRCQAGSPALVVARAVPAKCLFDVHHFRAENLSAGLTAAEWLQRTGAALAVNAGQYDEHLVHLGHLISKGKELGSGRHASFKGVFAVDTTRKGVPRARILDLLTDKFAPDFFRYACALQSFMLFDRSGRKRVLDSGKFAERTVLGLDSSGRVIIVTSEGQYTLWGMADLLRESDLNLKCAMSLDGGHAAQLSASGPDIRYDSSAARSIGRGDADPAKAFSPRLPAVLTIAPLPQAGG